MLPPDLARLCHVRPEPSRCHDGEAGGGPYNNHDNNHAGLAFGPAIPTSVVMCAASVRRDGWIVYDTNSVKFVWPLRLRVFPWSDLRRSHVRISVSFSPFILKMSLLS
jgi:hypothetical protein